MATQRSTDNIDVPNRRDTSWGLAPNSYSPAAYNMSYLAGAAISPYRIVKFSASGVVIQGAAAADTIVGINQSPQAAVANDPVMVALAGLGQVECGGTVVRGDLLTTDSVGRAVVSLAAPTDRTIGIALESGGTGTVIPVAISQAKNGGVT